MNRCKHNDCFTCPYDDCISDIAPKGTTSKRRNLSPDEKKIRKAQTNKKYYDKNRTRISELHRDYYRRRKEKRT